MNVNNSGAGAGAKSSPPPPPPPRRPAEQDKHSRQLRPPKHISDHPDSSRRRVSFDDRELQRIRDEKPDKIKKEKEAMFAGLGAPPVVDHNEDEGISQIIYKERVILFGNGSGGSSGPATAAAVAVTFAATTVIPVPTSNFVPIAAFDFPIPAEGTKLMKKNDQYDSVKAPSYGTCTGTTTTTSSSNTTTTSASASASASSSRAPRAAPATAAAISPYEELMAGSSSVGVYWVADGAVLNPDIRAALVVVMLCIDVWLVCLGVFYGIGWLQGQVVVE